MTSKDNYTASQLAGKVNYAGRQTSGKLSDWGRIKKHLAVTNGKTSYSDRGSSGLDTACVFQQQKLARCQRELAACRHRSWHRHRSPGRAGVGILVGQPWLQQDLHLHLPWLQLLHDLKSFNLSAPQDCSLSPLHHTRKSFAFSSTKQKADASTRKGRRLTNPEANCVHALAWILSATSSNNLPAHSRVTFCFPCH